jgi:hypothetical protein
MALAFWFLLAGHGAVTAQTLKATAGGASAPDYVVRSTPDRANRQRKDSIVTDTMMVFRTDSKYDMDWRAGPYSISSTLRAAVQKNGKTVPRPVTQKWNTVQPLTCEAGQVEARARAKGADEVAFQGARWVAEGRTGTAEPGVTLFGKLIDGDEKGKTLVTVESTITDDGAGGYDYKYAITNSSPSRVEVRWAGFRETVEPGKTFRRKLNAKKFAEEQSDGANITFKDGTFYRITANFWKLPS